MKKKGNILVAIGMSAILLYGCGTSNKIVGEYCGQDADGILIISKNKKWSYQQEDYWGSGEIDWNGTYSKDRDGRYMLKSDDIILYLEFISDDVITLTSDKESWSTENFTRRENY